MKKTCGQFSCSAAVFECVAMLGIFTASFGLPLMGIMA